MRLSEAGQPLDTGSGFPEPTGWGHVQKSHIICPRTGLSQATARFPFPVFLPPLLRSRVGRGNRKKYPTLPTPNPGWLSPIWMHTEIAGPRPLPSHVSFRAPNSRGSMNEPHTLQPRSLSKLPRHPLPYASPSNPQKLLGLVFSNSAPSRKDLKPGMWLHGRHLPSKQESLGSIPSSPRTP